MFGADPGNIIQRERGGYELGILWQKPYIIRLLIY
jgi:hypothetical protein